MQRSLLILATVSALAGCNGSHVRDHDSACSGIPGDPATPLAVNVPPATNGPGVATPAPLQMRASQSIATRRTLQLHGFLLSMLYVYDEHAAFALGRLPSRHAELADPLLHDAAAFGFWTEVENGKYYELPGVSSCEQLTLLGDDFSFRAPAGGFLFVQYRMHDCEACDRVSAAIQRTLDTHPEMPARWVQFDVVSTTNDWCYRGYGFWPRDRATEGNKDYTCLK